MIVNNYIVEVDIKHAALSIWREAGVISEEKYNELLALDKHERVVQTGLMRKDNPELTHVLYDGYKIYVNKLKQANNIPEEKVLHNVHDAVWLIGFIPEHLKFGLVEFDVKGEYNVFYSWKGLEFYLDSLTMEIKTRGVRKEAEQFVQLIRDILINYINDDQDRLYNIIHNALSNLQKDLDYYGPQCGVGHDINYKVLQNAAMELL